MAAVISTKIGISSQTVCSAIILTLSKVLTAAHCLVNCQSVSLIVGTTNLDESFQTINITEKDIVIHPDYSEHLAYVNDIAIIQLKSSLKGGVKVGKIDIVDKAYKISVGNKVYVLGYSENRLRLVNTTVHDMVACRNSYWERNNNEPRLDEKRQFCVKLDVERNDKYIGGTNLSLNFFVEYLLPHSF